MAVFFLENHFAEVFPKSGVFDSGAEAGAEVVFNGAEETGADFTIGGEPQAIAMSTKRFRDGSNNPNLAFALTDGPAFGGLGFVFGSNRNQREALLQAMENFLARDDEFFEPDPSGIERHEFDKPHADRAASREFRQGFDLVIVDPANDNRIDFDRREPKFLGEFDAGQNFTEAVPS